MADTIRDEAALQALFADNTSGAISAQDLRDFLVSVPSLASTANLALTGGTMTGSVIFASANLIRWNSDVSIGRNSATAIEINNGTAGTFRDLTARYINISGGDGFCLGAQTSVARMRYVSASSQFSLFTAVDSQAGILAGWFQLPSGRLRARTTTATVPTTAQFTADMDFGIHRDSATGDVWLAYNDGGTIKKVQLT